MSNPLLENNYIVDFDKVEPSHIRPAVDFLIGRANETIKEIEDAKESTWESIMGPINRLDTDFQRSFSPVPHLLSVRNSDELRDVYEQIQPDIVKISLKLQQSKSIFNKLKELKDGNEWSKLSPSRKRIVENKIRDAELSGIGLEEDQKKRFNEISEISSKLATKFSNNVLDSVKEWELIVENRSELEGLSDSFLESTSESYKNHHKKDSTKDAGPWRITLDFPIMEPVIRDCENREIRKNIYFASLTKASEGDRDNTEIISQLLNIRKEKAKLLGFKNFGELSTSTKMAGSVSAVTKLLDELLVASKAPGKDEIKKVQEFAAKNGHQGNLENWDHRFWSEKLRQAEYDFSAEQVREYFPLESVLKGMFALVDRIFDIKVVEAKGEAPVWHEDARFFKIFNKKNDHIASFILDPFSRPENKRGGAWMNECVTKRLDGDKVVVPVAYLVCNFSAPTKDKPSLLTFRDVETVFHEFGHGLQHMLTEITDLEASGINGVEWDAVELPSQFMENWCYHKPTIMNLSSHYKTGESLPDDLFKKLVAAKNFNAAFAMLRQLMFAFVDIKLHSEFDPNGEESVFEYFQKVAADISPMPVNPENRFLCSFSHIFAGGYSAGYYSYKWAEVLSADAFSAFEEVGLDNEEKVKEIGGLFKDTVLALGGSQHPMEIFKSFRGREPSTKPLLVHSGLVSA